MDTALKLKKALDSKLSFRKEEIIQYLKESELVTRLTSDFIDKPTFYVWRLIALSEIPYAQHLDYTKNLIKKIYQNLSIPIGFSLSGDKKMFLPCYNAMLVSALCKLGRAKDKEVKNAVDWINTNQPMKRGIEVSIPNLKFDKYGGCFKNTPCYIGIAKSVMALFQYQLALGDDYVKQKLDQGIDYMQEHQLINRLSSDKPITNHILDISFPASYNLNIVELIRFASQANLLKDKRTKKAIDFLEKSRTIDGDWKINYRYKAEGYNVFDNGAKSGEWVSYIIDKALNQPHP